MKFSRISKKAAAVIEANRQATVQVYSNYNGQSIRLSPLIRLTTASTNVIQHRNYYSCMKGVGYNMRDNTDFKKYNATLKTTTSRWISLPTKVMLEKIVVKVPTMGDSITEGTIVEWTAAVGQAVKTDDVIALIETDKVTIDIKADMEGVITQHFGSVDETVEVGAKLYELDTDAVASVIASAVSAQATASSSAPSEPAPVQSNGLPPKAETPPSDHRSPSIKFLGKDGWDALRKGRDTKKQVLNDAATPQKKHAVTTIFDDKNVKNPMYGRPKFTEAEMEALLTGGATLAPQVMSLSTGAKFKL